MDKTRHRSILHVLRNETDLTKERFQILAKPIVEVRFTNEKLRFIHVISQFTEVSTKKNRTGKNHLMELVIFPSISCIKLYQLILYYRTIPLTVTNP